jgi:hypothetical protein
MAARRHLPTMTTSGGPGLLSHLGMANCGPLTFHLALQTSLPISTFSRFISAAATAYEQQRNQDEDQ